MYNVESDTKTQAMKACNESFQVSLAYLTVKYRETVSLVTQEAAAYRVPARSCNWLVADSLRLSLCHTSSTFQSRKDRRNTSNPDALETILTKASYAHAH